MSPGDLTERCGVVDVIRVSEHSRPLFLQIEMADPELLVGSCCKCEGSGPSNRLRCSNMPLSVGSPVKLSNQHAAQDEDLVPIAPGRGSYTVEQVQALPLQEKLALG